MDPFLYAPVVAGFWSHEALVKNVFDIDDLLDAHEMLQVQDENRHRHEQFMKTERREM